MIAVLDVCSGNLRSVERALAHLLVLQNDCAPEVARCHGRTSARRRDLYIRLSRARALLLWSNDPVEDLASLAQVARLSQAHFVRLFHEVFGQPPLRFGREERLQRAHRLIAEGLSAERAGDLRTARAAYEKGAAGSSNSVLLLHYLAARAASKDGDLGAAARACQGVLQPRVYLPYRGVLWPDCVLWSAQAETDPARRNELLTQLVQAWRGVHPHPAVVEARKLLAQK